MSPLWNYFGAVLLASGSAIRGCQGFSPIHHHNGHHQAKNDSRSSHGHKRRHINLFSSTANKDTHRATHPTFETQPVNNVASVLQSSAPTLQAEQALASLASTLLALLSGDEDQAHSLLGNGVNSNADQKRALIRQAFQAYDVCDSGVLSVQEARELFVALARNIILDIANSDEPVAENHKNNADDESNNRSTATKNKSIPSVARAHAKRVLEQDESGNTIERVATKLLLLADTDEDGRVSLTELANLFDTVHRAQQTTTTTDPPTDSDNNDNVPTVSSEKANFPQPLRALAGSLQLLPPVEGIKVDQAASHAANWNVGVPGDDHTLRRVILEQGSGISVVGLGRSADASTYFLPELGIVMDAGIHVKSIRPKTLLLTHGHRDHIAALPAHAAGGAKIFVPQPILPLCRRFLLAEAQLNYGDATQTDEETIAALGEFDLVGVQEASAANETDADDDADSGVDHHDGTYMLPRESYTGSPTPLGIQVFKAPHKEGVPAVSYGVFRVKKRLKSEYASLPKSELGALMRNNKNIEITETYHEGIVLYTGDTTINLLKEKWRSIFPKYKHVIHEVTFLGKPSRELDESTRRKGHTHYAQLHPWICAFPDTTFICVHWSLRYSREDILKFFDEEYGGVPSNVVLWV